MECHITDSWIQEPDDLIDDYEGRTAHAEYLADMSRDDIVTEQMDKGEDDEYINAE